ncbi:MAG: winged helix-turn-helix domain-containing protein [candidate division WOR-3 bacterium]
MALEKRRYKGISLLKKGTSQSEVARKLGVSRQAVHLWWNAYQKCGKEAIRHHKSSGRPKKFSDRMKKRPFLFLSQGAHHFGFASDLWTINRIVQLIKDKFAVTLHRSHIHRLLISGGWSCQKPIRRAAERNEKSIQWGIKIKWPAIKKSPEIKSEISVY